MILLIIPPLPIFLFSIFRKSNLSLEKFQKKYLVKIFLCKYYVKSE